jgi:gamma-glutamylaminecyclotransferase
VTALFVYGTLLAGEPEHGRLAGAARLGAVRTAPGWTLVDLGPYPALVRGGAGRVEGELYEVDEPTLAALDEYEGCPTLFVRDVVRLDDGREAIAYVGLGCVADGAGRPIASGRWRERYNP